MKKVTFGSLALMLLLGATSCDKKIRREEVLTASTQGKSILYSPPTQSLPANWRAFSDDSPWNTPIASSTPDPKSAAIIAKMSRTAANIRFGASYLSPIWVVNSDQMPWYAAVSSYPFDIWDTNLDLTTEIPVPIDETMYPEPTEDGHIIVIDTLYDISWEMSRYTGISGGFLRSSTFNVWDLTGKGVGDPNEGQRWKARGGRAAGVPVIAGIIRPEEVQAGIIRHALGFTFPDNLKNIFYYPGARTDGLKNSGDFPAEGMRFRLDPTLTDADFTAMGLSASAIVVAHALQTYGMILNDNGGAMAIQVQLLDQNVTTHRSMWDAVAPGMHSTITRIPTNKFHLVPTGPILTGGALSTVTTPLISPQCGTFANSATITITKSVNFPSATIRYTLDGSTPTASSTLYSGPFTITSSKTVKARAFHSGKTDSPVMRAPIIITP